MMIGGDLIFSVCDFGCWITLKSIRLDDSRTASKDGCQMNDVENSLLYAFVAIQAHTNANENFVHVPNREQRDQHGKK